MKEKIKNADAKGIRGSARPFLQPLAVALVCVVLISLLLITGLMDLRTLDKTLVGYMENRGLAIIRNVSQVAEHYFQQLVQTQLTGLDAGAISPFTEDAFSLQESLIVNIVESAQEIDFKLETGRLGHEQLASLATKESLWLIALLDEQGSITFENRPVPRDVSSLSGPVIKGYDEIKINMFNRSGKNEEAGFIALRRKYGKGTIILALDDEDFRYMCLTVSVQRAIDDVGQGPDTSYLMVMDQRERILGQAGEPPEMPKEKPQIESILQGGTEVASRRISSGGQNLLEIVAPIPLAGKASGAVRLGLIRDRADQILKKEQVRVFISMGFMAAIAFLSMWFLYRTQNRHLARIQEMQRQLNQAERLSALGRLAAGVAHEVRNPLNAISMASQRLQSDNLDQLTGVIRDEIRRLNQIIEEFLNFSRTRKLEFSRHDLTNLLREIVLLMEDEAESKGVRIDTRFKDFPLMISMDFDKLKQALFNIMKNAIESISNSGAISLSVEPRGKEWISVIISDTGTGLTSQEIGQIFDPDYTTKEKGLGLGLPLAHEIIQGHGGEIRVRSQPGKGTTFEILMPAKRKADN